MQKVFQLIVLSGALIFQGCALWFKKHESDSTPTCQEMRRTCAEYDRLREVYEGTVNEVLKRAEETCNQYTYSCGQAVQRN